MAVTQSPLRKEDWGSGMPDLSVRKWHGLWPIGVRLTDFGCSRIAGLMLHRRPSAAVRVRATEWVTWTVSSFPSWCPAGLLTGLHRTMESNITRPAGSPHPCPENLALVNSSCKDSSQWLTPSPGRNTNWQTWPNPLSGLIGLNPWAGVWSWAESPPVPSWGCQGLGRVLGLSSVHRARQLWGMEKKRGWSPTSSPAVFNKAPLLRLLAGLCKDLNQPHIMFSIKPTIK